MDRRSDGLRAPATAASEPVGTTSPPLRASSARSGMRVVVVIVGNAAQPARNRGVRQTAAISDEAVPFERGAVNNLDIDNSCAPQPYRRT
ncbi:hypothetical protein JWG43_18550, partial [Desulfobulbus alkaliphilus]